MIAFSGTNSLPEKPPMLYFGAEHPDGRRYIRRYLGKWDIKDRKREGYERFVGPLAFPDLKSALGVINKAFDEYDKLKPRQVRTT